MKRGRGSDKCYPSPRQSRAAPMRNELKYGADRHCLACFYRAMERYNASLKEDGADEESMVGLAKTHLKRSVEPSLAGKPVIVRKGAWASYRSWIGRPPHSRWWSTSKQDA